MPLKLVVVEEPFQQQGMDFIGVINSNSLAKNKFILTATNYFTIWLEAMPCKNVDQETMIEMIKKIISLFGIPQTIISDNGPTFIGGNLCKFVAKYCVYQLLSSNYYL